MTRELQCEDSYIDKLVYFLSTSSMFKYGMTIKQADAVW